MEIITEFESTPPKPSRAPTPLDQEYENVFEVVLYDLETAQNVFARATKRDFNNQIDNAIRWQADDAREHLPQWVSRTDIVLRVEWAEEKKEWTARKKALAIQLSRTVAGLAAEIRVSQADRQLVFIEPLKTDVTVVGPSEVRFALKQKWTVENG